MGYLALEKRQSCRDCLKAKSDSLIESRSPWDPQARYTCFQAAQEDVSARGAGRGVRRQRQGQSRSLTEAGALPICCLKPWTSSSSTCQPVTMDPASVWLLLLLLINFCGSHSVSRILSVYKADCSSLTQCPAELKG